MLRRWCQKPHVCRRVLCLDREAKASYSKLGRAFWDYTLGLCMFEGQINVINRHVSKVARAMHLIHVRSSATNNSPTHVGDMDDSG
jgi:hypothetical protein